MVPSTTRMEFTGSDSSGVYGFLQLYIIVSKANMAPVFINLGFWLNYHCQ
jgi:hypothetical protein